MQLFVNNLSGFSSLKLDKKHDNWQASAEGTEEVFLGRSNAEALDGFLDGLEACPFLEASVICGDVATKVGKCGVPLLGEGCSKIPGLHHADVVVVATDGGDEA